MKCIYCYEGNEKKKMYMNEETIDSHIYIAEDANRDVFCGFFSSAYSHLVTIEIH